MPTRRVELATLDLPDFGLPTAQPQIPASVYEVRMAAARQRADSAGYDALIVYGDREHFANMSYLTGFDPRFEEALLILVPGRVPSLLVGNEGMGYSYIVSIEVERVLYQPFSLVSQPRDKTIPLKTVLANAGIGSGQRIGVAGWKYYTTAETEAPWHWLEVPAFIVDTLREMKCEPLNAGDLFMHPSHGLRAYNELEQLAFAEFAASYSSQGVRDLLFNIRAGMSEHDAFRLMGQIGLPLAFHPLVLSGERPKLGLASSSDRVIEVGDPVFAGYGPWGANTARGGFLVSDESQLPAGVHDYVDKLVAPYFRAVVEWYEQVGIGVPGGELYDIIHRHLSDPFFGVSLNPGHLIHLDEWLSSPVYKGSTEQLRSGMAIQVDVIPATNSEYHTTNIEDTIALADEPLRHAYESRFPQAWGRIQARRSFMEHSLGIKLKPEVLPFSNLPAYLPPYWLAPRRAMRAL